MAHSGAVTDHELMPLLATREFNMYSNARTFRDHRNAAKVPEYRNRLNMLANKLVQHLPKEVPFTSPHSSVDGHFVGVEEVF